MSIPLRVLFVEDSEDDMLLQMRELRRGGYEPVFQRVETAPTLQAALREHHWDLVISDFSLPQLTGLAALRLVHQANRDIPFILISGTVGEDVAVECMKAGATDYLLKDNLARMVPAVCRELRDAHERNRRREAEAQLRHSQSLLSLIYDHTDEMLALFSADDAGDFSAASVNRAWLAFAARLGRGVEPAACLGLRASDLIALLCPVGEPAQTLQRRFAETVQDLPSPGVFELEWRSPAGALFTEQQFIAFSHPGGRHVLWAGRDVTARKQADADRRKLEARLAHTQRLEMLGTLASGIAHDFNNVLAGLAGHTDLLQGLVGGLGAAQNSLQQLTVGIHRAKELVQRILAFSRKRTTLRKPLHLGPVVYEALQFLRPLLPRNVLLATNLPADGLQVSADAGQIHQVVGNLCTNGIQAMSPGGGTLYVSVEASEIDAAFAAQHPPLRAGQHVRLRVRDTGCGMDEQTLARLCEPFFTTRPAGEGTGLGLAVVQGLVTSHQGAMVVRSRPGEGTIFDLYFPALAEQQTETPGPATIPNTSKDVHVMFVDDEEYLAQMGVVLLERLGYLVSAFTNPERALAAFAAEPSRYALVITDLTMPGLKGTDLAERMRQIRPDLPVILTTGYSGPHEMERARRLGFGLLLEKPFTLAKMVELVEQGLKGS